MPDLSEFEGIDQAEVLRRQVWDLERRLLKAKHKTEDLVEATLEGAKQAMLSLGPLPPVPKPEADKRTRKPEVAVWHLTDWQGSKLTPTYNTEIMRERVLRFCEKAAKLTDIQRADHPVRKCVILFGGDHLEGLFNYPAQLAQIDQTLFGQFMSVGRLQVEVVRRALAVYDEVEVVAEWGNHGRIGAKRAEVVSSDNMDRMAFELARSMLEGEKRLCWPESSPADLQHVEIGNYRALLVHGDEIGRNGFVSKPRFVQGVNRWRSGAHRWEFKDVYVGHFHTHEEHAMANGEGAIYWTGSPESDNRYASDSLASSALPSQRLHFVDPVKGRVTAQYKVHLID